MPLMSEHDREAIERFARRHAAPTEAALGGCRGRLPVRCRSQRDASAA